jgi:hypothetical protein
MNPGLEVMFCNNSFKSHQHLLIILMHFFMMTMMIYFFHISLVLMVWQHSTSHIGTFSTDCKNSETKLIVITTRISHFSTGM